MSGNNCVEFSEGGVEALPVLTANLLPCSIAHNGDTDVDTYFVPEKLPKKTQGQAPTEFEPRLKAAFRGRQLLARGTQFKENAVAVVLQRQQQGRNWKACGRFEEINVWSPDQDISNQQHMRKSLNEWLSLSKAIHGEK